MPLVSNFLHDVLVGQQRAIDIADDASVAGFLVVHVAEENELIATRRAAPVSGCDAFAAVGADLAWRVAALVTWKIAPHRINRPVASDVSAEVENNAIPLARCETKASADHLRIKTRRHRRAQQRD
jgi:hypothetical protein